MTLFKSNIGHKIYLALLLVIIVLTAVINYSNPQYYIRFLGAVNPLYVIVISGLIGFAIFLQFFSKYGLNIFKSADFKSAFRYLWLIIPFTAIAILVDCKIVFPMDINVPFPESFLFYPAIAFFVEILFHVLPIATLILLLTTILKSLDQKIMLWICIFLVALIEPTYQIKMGSYPSWALMATWINLYFFNLTQLIIFKYYGFISMYIYRLFYYLIWHIVWGHLRLDLLSF